MLNSKLITFLSSFSEEEIKDFEKFSSTFFTAGRNVDVFLKLLKKAHPSFAEKEIKKENVFKKLYPGKEYNDKMMTAQIVSLTKAVEDFMIYQNLKNNNELRDQILMKEFLERKLYKYYAAYFPVLEKNIKKKEIQADVRFILLTELYSDASVYYSSIDNFKGFSENLAKFMNSFVTMVFLNSFPAAVADKTLFKYYNLETPPNIFKDFLRSIDIDKFISEIPDGELEGYRNTIKLYYYLYLAYVEDGDLINLENAMKAFDEVRSMLNMEEKKLLYRNVDQIYMQIYNSGKTEIRGKIYELYRSMLSDGIYNHMGGIEFDTTMFRAICLGAGDDPEWVESVIEKFSHLLREDVRDSYIAFGNAHICIARNKFEEALDHVGKITYASFMLKTDVKILTLVVYYEMNYYEEAISVIDSYKHYIANTKDLSPVFKELYSNFTMIVLKLFRLRENYSKDEADYLKHQTKNTKLPGYDAWILRKIDELEKKAI